MPVNDSPLADAEVNCALCVVAGIVGTTAETERLLVEAQAGGHQADAAMVFYEYGCVRAGQARSLLGKNTIRIQVAGVQHWLVTRHGRRVNLIGSTDNPLQAGALAIAMQGLPVGTDFVVLVLDWNDDFGQATAGHWLNARRTPAGLQYTDYQLDVPGTLADAMRRQTKRRQAPFGQPSVTDGPREAFGDPSGGENRYMALSVEVPAVGGGSSCLKCCYITTATCAAMGLPDDCEELETLRRYRDMVLLATPQGAAEVDAYYAAAPAIVAALDRRADAALVYRHLYEHHIAPAAAAAGRGDHATAYALFRSGVERAAALAEGAAFC